MSRLDAALKRAQKMNEPIERRHAEAPWPPPPPREARDTAASSQHEEPVERITRPPAPVTTEKPLRAVYTAAKIRPDIATAEKLVGTPELEQWTVEQYRKLAATLHHAQAQRDLKILMVCSALSGDGKTLTATNLALTLSESYHRRVLLIDADLRRPSLHQVFELRNVDGLSECLTSETEHHLPVMRTSPYLDIVVAGAPDSDPMSGLTSGRMRRLLSDAADTYDWVIIDTPPVVLLPDANLLAAMADGAILVIGAGSTPHKLVMRAVEALGRERILGVVLNRAERSILVGGYAYGYGYGYGSGYGSGARAEKASDG
jgi:capsular exopolysaccharide synthesis family protein